MFPCADVGSLAAANWRDTGVPPLRAVLQAVGQRSTAAEREPIERRELGRICGDLRIPGGFEVAQISWKPDYDPVYYEQLRKRARPMYLFHGQYIFAPGDIARFVRQYTTVNKDDIRKNRNGAAERLSFIGRVMHGAHLRT